MFKRFSFTSYALGLIATAVIGLSFAQGVQAAPKDDSGCTAKGTEYSCMDKTKGESCEVGLCMGGVNIQCCKAKAAAGAVSEQTQAKQPAATGGDVGGGLDSTAGAGGLKSVATDIPSAVGKLIGNVMGIIGALMLVYFIYGGVRWMTAGGESKGTQDAIAIIRNAVIGMMIIGMSYMIADFAFKAVQTTLQGQTVTPSAK